MKRTLLIVVILAIVCLGCEAAVIPAPTPILPPPPPPVDKLNERREALEKKLAGRGFTVLVETPFVVVGDESPERVRSRSVNTVRWAVDKLKQDFFAKDPDEIIEVWLFKDAQSYKKHAKEFFNDDPDTPYGYYSPSDKALVMNISTGGGTLVHEIVHPYMRANFPNCPAWFNEGMGSLFEQSAEVGGRIRGLTNWRLPGLQRGLERKVVPSFLKLTSMTDTEFYREDTGTNYAQSRYLLYYLQNKGLLTKFYRDFTANAKTDPTGYKTLVKTLRAHDMTQFRRDWETFVTGLRVGTE